MRGKDFDRQFVDGQIQAQNQALDLIDRILPNVKSTQVRTGLQDMRSKVYNHLRAAEKVQQKLQAAN